MDIYAAHVLAFLFVLTRISGLVLLAPLGGVWRIGLQVRVVLAVALALMVAPVCDAQPLEALLADAGQLLVAGCREAVLGLVFGTAVVLLIAALQAGGHLVGQMSGMSLAEAVEGSGGGAASGFGRLFAVVGIAAFFLTGGYRQVLAALLETFQWMPPGQAGFSSGLFDVLSQIAAQSFHLAVRATAPVLVALLLSALLLGVLHRVMPQLNAMSLGFSLNVLGVLGLVALTLGGVAWSFQSHLEEAVDRLGHAVQWEVPGESFDRAGRQRRGAAAKAVRDE
jgi:flagellar biosynthesis protein FliR